MTSRSESARRRLSARRRDVLDAAAATDGGRAPVALDPSRVGRLARMDASRIQAMAQEAERRRAREIRRIDAALDRIDAGEYGHCVRCGDGIEAERPELDRAAPLSIGCAEGAGAG